MKLPNSVDFKPVSILRPKRVQAVTGLHITTLNRYVREGKFPLPLQLNPDFPGSPIGCLESEVTAWIESRTRVLVLDGRRLGKGVVERQRRGARRKQRKWLQRDGGSVPNSHRGQTAMVPLPLALMAVASDLGLLGGDRGTGE